MRTTLDIDDVVLSAARAKARAERISLGRAVSELALRALAAAPEHATRTSSGLPVLHGVAGHVVTDDLVADYRDDD